MHFIKYQSPRRLPRRFPAVQKWLEIMPKMSESGPDNWHKLYPIANGDHQSPIDIQTKEVKKDASLGLLRITWKPSTCKEIVNVGHSFHVNFEDKDNQSVLTGGPLTGTYRLRQFYFYWGQTDDQGSEHAVDRKRYASELHLVHWKADKYSNAAEASDKPDGSAIVTVFLKLGLCNENLKGVLKALDSVKTKGKQAPSSDFDPSSLLPKSLYYWTYNGSLTHPPLHESVIWIILKEPITISSEQSAQFRTILSSAEGEAPCPILSNHRQPQPLKGRVVRGYFQTNKGNLEHSLLIKSNTSTQRLQKNLPKK